MTTLWALLCLSLSTQSEPRTLTPSPRTGGPLPAHVGRSPREGWVEAVLWKDRLRPPKAENGALGQGPSWWGPTVCRSHSFVLEAAIHESSPNKLTFPAYWSSSSGWVVWSHSCQHSTIVKGTRVPFGLGTLVLGTVILVLGTVTLI